MKFVLPKPVECISADSYRDGGSYSMKFIDDAGLVYCLFLKVIIKITKEEFKVIGYAEPMLQIFSPHNFDLIEEKILTWAEANELSKILTPLSKAEDFSENFEDAEVIFQIINLNGKVLSGLKNL